MRRPHFIVDAMLGRLARWLRLLGYDTVYARDISDAQLVAQSRRERRLILTRDHEVLARRGVRALCVRSDQWHRQLKQVMADLRLVYDGRRFFTRCSLCNTPLKRIGKLHVKRRVPAVVYREQQKFWVCRRCRKIYWMGSHGTLSRRRLKAYSASFIDGEK